MTVANGNRAASATWLTGLTFSILAVPLAMFGAKSLDVSLGKVSLRGALDDYAMEYLGAASVLSLGLGASRLMKASKDSQKSINNSNAELPSSTSVESLMSWADSDSSLLTEASLKDAGLHMFLDEDDAPLLVSSASVNAAPRAVEATQSVLSEPQVPEVVQQVSHASERISPVAQPPSSPDALASIVAEVQSMVNQVSAQSQEVAAAQAATTSVAHNPISPASETVVHVAALPLAERRTAPIFPAAQPYVSFARSQGLVEQAETRDLTAELAVLEQIYQMREQMQHLMNQVDLIQADLEQTVYPAQRLVPLRAAQAPSYTVSSVEPLRAVTAQASDVWDNYCATA